MAKVTGAPHGPQKRWLDCFPPNCAMCDTQGASGMGGNGRGREAEDSGFRQSTKPWQEAQ